MSKTILKRNENIRKLYNKRIDAGENPRLVIKSIATEHDLGEVYITHTILKGFAKKTVYDRKDKVKLDERNKQILEMYDNDDDANVIAEKFDLSPARIRQVIRAAGRIPVQRTDSEEDIHLVDQILSDVKSNMSYKAIMKKYGKDNVNKASKILVRRTEAKNVFRLVMEKRDNNIIVEFKGGKSPLEIAVDYIARGFFRGTLRSVRSYIYTMLNSNGCHSRLSEDEQKERDEKILRQLEKGEKVNDLADKYNVTPSAIRMMARSKVKPDTKKRVIAAKKKQTQTK